jgi:hypothetical protein
MNIYVASSWRNSYQPAVVHGLREVGHEVYDFRHPTKDDDGFNWKEIDPSWQQWSIKDYIEALSHPLAEAGFEMDFDAMKQADVCVLVMPCGRSAHLEAGYFCGVNKPLLILTSEGEPELIYKMADSIHEGMGSLLIRLQEIADGELNDSIPNIKKPPIINPLEAPTNIQKGIEK